jgi:uncharacterized damage-inducible protein DinB
MLPYLLTNSSGLKTDSIYYITMTICSHGLKARNICLIQSVTSSLPMDLEDFKELFEYNHQVRKNYLHSFQKIISWEDMIKNRETAWLSMKDILRIMWVENTWINYSIQGLDDPNRPFPYHKYQTWNALIDYNQEVTSKTKRYLSNIQKKDLLKPVFRVNIDGVRRTCLVKDVLIHVFTGELHHRGEITAILWQMDIQPPDMGWLSVMKKTNPQWIMK